MKTGKKASVNKQFNEESRVEKLKVLLEEISGLESYKNPIIRELELIYLKKTRINTYEEGVIQAGAIVPSTPVDIFTDTLVSVELNSLASSQKLSHRYKVTIKDFPTSVFDVFLTHYQIIWAHNKLSFPTTNTNFSTIDVDDILFFKVVNKTTFIFRSNGRYYKSMKPLEEFVKALERNPNFYRINKGYLVNLNKFEDVVDFQTLIPLGNIDLTKLKEDIIEATKYSSNGKENLKLKKEALLKFSYSAKESIKNSDNELQKIINERNKAFFSDFIDINKEYFTIPIKEDLQKEIQKIVVRSHRKKK